MLFTQPMACPFLFRVFANQIAVLPSGKLWELFFLIAAELWLQRTAKLLIHKEIAACMSRRVKFAAGQT